MCIVSSADIAGETLPGNKHIYIRVANDQGARFDLFGNDSYYVKFDGGGLNALHITANPQSPFGQVTKTGARNGTFYISDTGGRGFFDDLVLLVAVQEPLPDSFAVRIRSSGYTWSPTTEVNLPPDAAALAYHDPALDETFDAKDFRYEPQSWKPSGTEHYPLMEGVDPASTEKAFRLLFVDLGVGALGLNSDRRGLVFNGTARVDYTLVNATVPVSFNVYGWNNQSNQGQGISWTNRISGTGSSGYIVLSGPESGTASASSEFTGSTPGIPVQPASPAVTPIPVEGLLERIGASVTAFLRSLGLTENWPVAGDE
jgi:hypothetical protein